MQPVLFYTIGYPGAGKTTVARALSTWVHGVHLRADKIGLELFYFPTYSPAERQAVHQEMQYRAGDAIKNGQTVIYDAATNARAERAAVVSLGRSLGVPVIGLWLQTPTKTAMQRAGKLRDQRLAGPVARVLPPEVFKQYVAMFEQPSPGEDVILLPGTQPFAVQYRHLQRQLRNHNVTLPHMV